MCEGRKVRMSGTYIYAFAETVDGTYDDSMIYTETFAGYSALLIWACSSVNHAILHGAWGVDVLAYLKNRSLLAMMLVDIQWTWVKMTPGHKVSYEHMEAS
jgi:hypothetical protein